MVIKRYLSIFSDPLTLEFPYQRHKNLFLCEFHGQLEENLAENWFQSKEQVSREILGVKAALWELNFVCKLHEFIYYFQNISIRRLKAY